MKKLAFALMTVSLVVSIPSFAEEKAQRDAWGGAPAAEKPAKKAEPVVLQDLTLTGRISKSEKTNKEGKTTISYVLIDANGKEIKLPIPKAPKAKKGEAAAPAIVLDVFVDKTATIMAKGTETTDKKGAKSVHVKEITNILLAAPEAAPAVAPAAPAPAPAEPAQ